LACFSPLPLSFPLLPPPPPYGGVTAFVRDYLEAHYAEAVSLEQLAGLVQRHPRHLIEAFRRAYGVPPHTYLLQRRVREAKRLLLSEQAPLAVALSLGFYDQAHFAGTFKRFTGVTPGQFRHGAVT
jgi:AraC-like DNA-binding protein